MESFRCLFEGLAGILYRTVSKSPCDVMEVMCIKLDPGFTKS